MSSHASDIRGLQGESAGQEPLHRGIDRFRIRSLDLIAETPGDEERAIRVGPTRNGVGEGYWVGRRRAHIDVRQVIDAGEAWGGTPVVCAGGVFQLCAETKGSGVGEGIHDALAEVIVVHAKAGADGGFAVRRVCDREARGEVQLLLRPVAGLAHSRPTGREGDQRLIDLPLLCRDLALLVPGVDVHVWRYLLAVRVIRGLQDGVAQAEGQGEIGSWTPGVLKEPFEFICAI